jgi:hypothetical protein
LKVTIRSSCIIGDVFVWLPIKKYRLLPAQARIKLDSFYASSENASRAFPAFVWSDRYGRTLAFAKGVSSRKLFLAPVSQAKGTKAPKRLLAALPSIEPAVRTAPRPSCLSLIEGPFWIARNIGYLREE